MRKSSSGSSGPAKNSAAFAPSLAHFASSLRGAFPAGRVDLSVLKDVGKKSLKEVKQILESPVMNMHSGISLDTTSVAASMFLARKVLPSIDKKKDVEQRLFDKLVNPGPKPAGDDWLDCAGEVIAELFPEGWDKNWPVYPETSVRTNPTAGLKRGESAREDVELSMSWVEFSERVASGDLKSFSEMRRIVGIEDAGKIRPITVASGLQAQLRPLHNLLYDHLSQQRWLLRGEPSSKEMSLMLAGEDMGLGRDDEVFVSGDYEAATDNFVPWNSARLLALIFSRSKFIPGGVMEAAFRQVLGGVIALGDQKGVRQTAQLMGDYCSFPLLCLTNFVGFIFGCGPVDGWRIAREGLLLINGDDIVFRSSRSSAERWMGSVGDAGLVLSRGKTLIHPRVISINSTFFTASTRLNRHCNERYWHVRRVPVIRLKTWVKPGSYSLEGRLKRIITDADCKVRSILKSFFGSIWKRVERGGLPVALGTVLAELDEREGGIIPRGWKERVGWLVDHPALVYSKLSAGPPEQDAVKSMFRLNNLDEGRRVGKWSQWHRAAATFRTAIGWGVSDLRKPSNLPDLQGWGNVIPKPVVNTFPYFRPQDRPNFLSEWGCVVSTGCRRIPRAGIGCAVERVWVPDEVG